MQAERGEPELQQPCPEDNMWADIKARYNQAQSQQSKEHQVVVEPTEHTSELTPWLRGTGYASYLEGLLLEEILAAY